MKLSTLILFTGIAYLSANEVQSQEANVHLNVTEKTIAEVLKDLEKQTSYLFFYNEKDIDVTKTVTGSFNNSSVSDVLSSIFSGTDVNYALFKDYIVLTKNNITNKITGAQQQKVTGKVIDAYTGEPLPGVYVRIEGTQSGTITDENGKYSLEMTTQSPSLLFSFVGYISEIVSVEGKSVIDITLVPELTALDEVVVVGYGTKKKLDLTGSISSVSGKKMEQSNSVSIAQALQGQTSGVYVKSNSGQPGGGVSVRIRGIGGINDSEPLYIIDGVQRAANGSESSDILSSINPNDIESIEVLKDASSSAIYGARAANGVVLITTKRGAKGDPHFSYRGSIGMQNVTNPNDFGLLNAGQYAERVNTSSLASGGELIFGGTNTITYPVEYFPSPSALGEGTNWLDVVMRENAPVQEHQISVSGGKDKHQYYLSLNYYDQDGIIVESGYKRYTLRLNTDNTITKWLKIGNSLSLSRSVQNGISSIRQWTGGDMYIAMHYSPLIPVYNEDGSYAGPPTAFYSPERNPLALVKDVDRAGTGTDILGNLYAEVSLIKGLTFKSSLSVTLYAGSWDTFAKSYSEGITTYDLSNHTYGTGESNSWMWNNVLSYNTSIKKHNLSALAGMEASEYMYTSLQGSAKFTDDNIKVVRTTGAETDASFEEYITSSSLISYFGRLSYNFDHKYYIEGNARRDGSSQFGINSHWGVFPSVSAAWRISKENFFPESFIYDLKLRAGYGEVGNNKIGNFTYVAPLTTVLYSMSGNTGDFETGLTINSLANPDIKWETSKQLNVGLDLAAFKNKLTFAAEYFETNVEDMLLEVSIPAYSGISSSGADISQATITTNAGSLTNKGVEIDLSYKDNIGPVSFGVGMNLTTFNNKITDIGDNEQIWGFYYNDNYLSRTIVGGSLGEFYGYVTDGIFQTQAEVDAANALDGDATTFYQTAKTAPGDFKYRDINNDKIVNADDRTKIGSPIPDFTYGFSFNIGYKDFNLDVLFSGTQGNDIFNANKMNLEASGEQNFNKSKTVINAWNGEGSSNTIPRAISTDPNQNKRPSDIYVEDGSYLRLRNIRLGYNLPKVILSKINISDMNIYISGQNLLTFTKYSGFDPEVGNYNGGNTAAGIDTDIYPQSRSFHVGTVINF